MLLVDKPAHISIEEGQPERSSLFKLPTFLLLGAALFSSPAFAAGFELLKGKWVSSLPVDGQVVVFPSDLRNYDVMLPGFQSLSSIRQAGGHNGSHIKVLSQTGLMCFYSISFNESEMTWEQRDGGSNCPKSITLERAK